MYYFPVSRNTNGFDRNLQTMEKNPWKLHVSRLSWIKLKLLIIPLLVYNECTDLYRPIII